VTASNAINSADEVDWLLAQGWTGAEIAARLGMLPHHGSGG